jgi:hypothetical protein
MSRRTSDGFIRPYLNSQKIGSEQYKDERDFGNSPDQKPEGKKREPGYRFC